MPLFRSLLSSLLLLSLRDCAAPTPKAPPVAAPGSAKVRSTSARGITLGSISVSDSAYRRVQAADVLRADTVYAATLPVLNVREGSIRMRVVVHPRTHAINNLEALFAPHQAGVTYRQIGQGVGKYKASKDRYEFNAGYQRVRKLANGRTDGGEYQEIIGWVRPDDSTAAVALPAVIE